jgi:hypothetical protein
MDKGKTNPSQQPDFIDAWTEYVSELIEESEQIEDKDKFYISFLVDKNGILDTKAYVPLNSSYGLKEWASKLLAAISEGTASHLIVEALAKFTLTAQASEKESASEILELWRSKNEEKTPCIKPTEVLKK